FTRRRMLRITAGASLAGLLGVLPGSRNAHAMAQRTWRGVALGADASITLHHPDPAHLETTLAQAVAELRRLENIFSLYRPESALNLLNRDGVLDAPPLDLVRLLGEARSVSELTDGAFDVTVQPLWDLYARHFAEPDADPAGPDGHAVAEARARVGYQGIEVRPDRIGYRRPRMAVTLNGIAQGYITDRVVDLLRGRGLRHVLVDLGEIRGLGHHPQGRAWVAGIKDPRAPERLLRRVELGERALATSGGYGLRFDRDGRHTHLFDPRTGTSPQAWASVSVLAGRATLADALSTGFSAMPEAAIRRVVNGLGAIEVLLVRPDGDSVELTPA
ncbi:MAG: FAD:protein FMN transferase, partial [Alphaproteobacteria bacterium]|nr:FAD:protein FMN transferase [Alphaproteobacteria bacterium]